MTHNFVFNTDCFASQIRETQHNTTHTLKSRKPLSSSIYWRLILFMIFSSMMLSPFESNGQTDTLICDNGGFEDDFDYYFGYLSSFSRGSDSCKPLSANVPVNWTLSDSLPKFRRFEIVASGTDPLVGIDKTKFGNKALQLNNRYGHNVSYCNGSFDINKIVKRFKVTEENREFTVWFAVVLEYPLDHHNSQPFFSITCDRADNNLCFDADLLNCSDEYYDPLCTFDPIDVVDWTCYRIRIPESMIDSIATLEIMVADCGEGDHFGYAYIDGICEECVGGSLGSVSLFDLPFDSLGVGIKYKSCYKDTITVCGSYTLPFLCGEWTVDHIEVPGFTIYNFQLQPDNTFCFDLAKSDFTHDLCRDLYVNIYFESNISSALITQTSNSIEICPDDFDEYNFDIVIGNCQNNGTSDLLSDDYYYVNIDLDVNIGDSWVMERQLNDPYPNESGQYIIKNGIGSGTISLGPLLIQEGSWTLIVTIGNCAKTFQINPPGFCSGCDKFYRTKIFDITCSDIPDPGSADPSDDTWSFHINVQGDPMDYFLIDASSYHYVYGTTYDIPAGTIGHECIKIRLKDPIHPTTCFTDIYVCPPKPCSNPEECTLEVNVTEVYCDNENNDSYIELDISGAESYLCYKASKTNGTLISQGNLSSTILGPFTEDIWLEIKICTTAICTCSVPYCFKVMYVPKPDCDNLEFRSKGTNNSETNSVSELSIIPNPINGNELILISSMKNTIFEFYNSSSKLIKSGKFSGTEFRLSIEIPAGIYFVRYKNSIGKYRFIKVIKL